MPNQPPSRLFPALNPLINSHGIKWPEENEGMGKWIKRTSMPTPRHDLQSIAVDGKIYAISGADDLTLDVV